MSDTIPVRTCAGQVLQVPPARISWAAKAPRLVELMDVLRDMQTGAWKGSHAQQLALCGEFLAEVARIAGWPAVEGGIEADVVDCMRVHAALRGIPPDPTRASPAGSGT